MLWIFMILINTDWNVLIQLKNISRLSVKLFFSFLFLINIMKNL